VRAGQRQALQLANVFGERLQCTDPASVASESERVRAPIVDVAGLLIGPVVGDVKSGACQRESFRDPACPDRMVKRIASRPKLRSTCDLLVCIYRSKARCAEVGHYYCDYSTTSVVFTATLAVTARPCGSSAPSIAHRVIFKPNHAVQPNGPDVPDRPTACAHRGVDPAPLYDLWSQAVSAAVVVASNGHARPSI
jgi:hypothetical protein